METLKHDEDRLMVLRFDAHPVIADAKDPFLLSLARLNVNARRGYRAILDRVADKVLEELQKLSFMSRYGG